MKEFPEYDFPVRAWAEGEDYAGAVREAYNGIYCVSLNRIVTITFIPRVDRRQPWPPELPEDFDVITDVETARRSVLALASLAVVGDDSRAGSTESRRADDEERTIFYVGTDELAELSRDVKALCDETPWVHDRVRFSKLAGRALGRFVSERVLPSGRLTLHQLHMLGRQPDGRTPEN
jgi:hypothetical protein